MHHSMKKIIDDQKNNDKKLRKCMKKMSNELVKCMKQVSKSHHAKYSKTK